MNFSLNLYQHHWRKIATDSSITSRISDEDSLPLFVFDRLTSTNTKLWELIDRQVKLPIGAIALQQTAGKGQWGHSWVSAKGGLYLSVGLDLNLETNNYFHLVMSTAWGIATVLRHYELPVTIKWSNDLILDRRKLGGIKIETKNDKNKLVKAVVGVGINWQNLVPKPGINLATYYRVNSTKAISSLEELTAITSYGILFGHEYYLAVGIDKLLNKYLEILSSLGQQVNFNGSSAKVIGVTKEGKLRLKLQSLGASTEIAIAPGQISLGYR